MIQLLVGLPIVLAALFFITCIGGVTRVYLCEDNFDSTPREYLGCLFLGVFVTGVICILLGLSIALGVALIGE